MKAIPAIKKFFERDDAISPGGGRKIEMEDLKPLTKDERAELGRLCCAEMGETFES